MIEALALAAGWLGQGLFFARGLVQWLRSERAGRSVAPASYWWMSLLGTLGVSSYAAHRGEAILLTVLAINAGIYLRNLLWNHPRTRGLRPPLPLAALAGLAAQIKSQAHGRIFVRGHSDSDPIKKPATLKRFPKGNLQLSSERAVSVARILIDDGKLSAKMVTTMGFGPHQPVKPNNSADNKRLNRRVEIFVADPTTP